MRKRIINQRTPDVTAPNQQWLNLERLAQVEVTSEDPALSIESALIPDSGPGWRAADGLGSSIASATGKADCAPFV